MADQPWPSFNQAILMGKVTAVTRISWEDGSVTALINVCTKKKVATADGKMSWGRDHHQVEITPGQQAIAEIWKGAIVQFRGEIDTFPWTPKGSTVSFNRSILLVRGYQVIQPSPLERVLPKPVYRKYKNRAASVLDHSHNRSDADE